MMALARLRILVFPESSRIWTARALEHDLAGGGATMEAALDTVLKVARAHINYDLRHGRPLRRRPGSIGKRSRARPASTSGSI